jgi:hypothetical protein
MAIPKADVVASNVNVDQRITRQWSVRGSFKKRWKRRREPRFRAQSQPKERSWVGRHRWPAELVWPDGAKVGWRRCGVNDRKGVEHGTHLAVLPGRRPLGARQILEGEGRDLAVVREPQELGQKRTTQ